MLHKTALFARCTIVPCVEDDVHVATLPAAHSSLLCAINNHVRTMRSTQLRRFQCRQGATAFAAAAASLVRAQPSVFKPCPTWIQARLTRPTEVMDYPVRFLECFHCTGFRRCAHEAVFVSVNVSSTCYCTWLSMRVKFGLL